jgi:hypothetical protein
MGIRAFAGHTGATPPIITCNSGSTVSAARIAAGSTAVTLVADRGIDATESIVVAQYAEAQAASGMQGLSAVDTGALGGTALGDVVKGFSAYHEAGAGGASAAADAAVAYMILDGTSEDDECSIMACGSWNGATSTWRYNDGGFTNAFTLNAAGDWTFNLQAANGSATGDVAIFVAPRGAVLAGSDIQTTGVVWGSATTIRVTSGQEQPAGAASALTTMDLDIVVLAENPRGSRGGGKSILLGWALIDMTTGAPAIVRQSGCVQNITSAAAGDATINLMPALGRDASECVIIAKPMGVGVASSMWGISVIHTSDTAKRIMAVQEQAGGAASIAADCTMVAVAIFGRA